VLPDDETRLEQGDTVVLSGIPENLAVAEQKLMRAQ
jgi:K+/H+ antiporter YhaU regulatory subunit KhtT